MFIQKLCHRDKRPQNSSDYSIWNLYLKHFRGRTPGPPSNTASLRLAAATVPATSTSFLIFREVDLPLYAFSYLAPLVSVASLHCYVLMLYRC